MLAAILLKSMRVVYFYIILIISTAGLNYCSSKKKFDPSDIPPHQYFLKKNINWQTSPYNDSLYMKAIGDDDLDTMVIATSDKLILITGQYGLKPGDTVIMPYSGEFGINYEVLSDKSRISSTDSAINIAGQTFVASSRTKFEWWPEIIHRIDKVGKGKVIVSGP